MTSNATRISTITALTMFTYDFMQNAFAAAGIVAVVSGLDRLLPGAARADLRRPRAVACRVRRRDRRGAGGVSAALGTDRADVLAGVGMGVLGERLYQRDVAIGIVLAMSLGLGLLFLNFFTAYATQATALLFGNILGVDAATVWTLLAAGRRRGCGAGRHRPAVAVRQPAAGTGRGEGRVAAAGVGAVPGHRCARRGGVRADRRRVAGVRADGGACCGGATIDLAFLGRAWRCRWRWRSGEAWLGLVLAYITDWPTSFWITMLGGAVYLVAVLRPWLVMRCEKDIAEGRIARSNVEV